MKILFFLLFFFNLIIEQNHILAQECINCNIWYKCNKHGVTFLMSDRPTKALECFNSAINNYTISKQYNMEDSLRKDQLSMLYQFRGRAYIKVSKCEDAIKDFNKAIELDPKYAESYFLIGKS